MLIANRLNCWIAALWLGLGLSLSVFAADSLPKGLTKDRYLGWEGAMVIESEEAEAKLVAVPGIGGRIMRYEVMGDNILWDNPATYGLTAAISKRALLPGGYQMFVVAEKIPAADSERLEFGPYELAAARDYSLTLVSDFASTSLKLEKEIVLDAGNGEVGISQKVKNISDHEIALSIRARTQCKGGGFFLAPLGKYSRLRAGWALRHLVDGKPVYDNLNPASPQVKNLGGILVVEAKGPETRLALDTDGEWVAYVLDRTMLVQYFPYDYQAKYPEGHTVEVGWTELVAELELLGVEAPLAANATRTAPVKWTTIPLNEPVITVKQARALVKKVPPSPFRAGAK